MFGYIRACKSEMKIKEYETYRAVYCSLCREMGRRYGVLTRLALSYDFTFLALLSVGLSEAEAEFKNGRCVCNPLKKCKFCSVGNAYALPAAASVMMVYYKAADDFYDEKGFSRLRALFLKLLYSLANKKASRDYPEVAALCAEYMAAQRKVEEEKISEPDLAADPTAKFLSSLFCLLANDDSQKRVLERLGYCLGRWLYLLDALDDKEKDEQKSAYNPLVLMKRDEETDERIMRSIIFSESEAQAAFELLEPFRMKSVTSNILYLGLKQSRENLGAKNK